VSLAPESKVAVPGELNRHAALAALNDKIHLEGSRVAEWLRRTKPNKRFDRSGMSLPFIVNSNAARRCLPPGQSRRYASSFGECYE
jgi:hypothetical protein